MRSAVRAPDSALSQREFLPGGFSQILNYKKWELSSSMNSTNDTFKQISLLLFFAACNYLLGKISELLLCLLRSKRVQWPNILEIALLCEPKAEDSMSK